MIVRMGSVGLFWTWLLSPPCMCFWDVKGSELYMQPVIEELCKEGIPVAAKPLGLQCLDGWTCVLGWLDLHLSIPKFVARIVANGPQY